MKQKHADEIADKVIESIANGINQIIAWSVMIFAGLLLYAGVMGMICQVFGIEVK